MVNNNVNPVKCPSVVVLDYNPSKLYRGSPGEINAGGSYDANNDAIAYEWIPPGDMSVSATNGSVIKFLTPVVSAPKTLQFTLKITTEKQFNPKSFPLKLSLTNLNLSKLKFPKYLPAPSNILISHLI